MIYLSWAALYEGGSDNSYFEIMIPRLMEHIVALHGTITTVIPTTAALKLRRAPFREAAVEACGSRDAFELIFVHADTGGRGLDVTVDSRSRGFCEEMHNVCQWPHQRCISISPRHETEAWVLADRDAVLDALGYRGSPESIGLPANARHAERLTNPKAVIEGAVSHVRGRRKTVDIKPLFAAIAQRQSFERLREARSFLDFENNLRSALFDVGCIRNFSGRR